jgi:Uma2 family endonuclease
MLSPSPNRSHQWFAAKFIQKVSNEPDAAKLYCTCNIYSELDWIMGANSFVRPDCMIVCGNFIEDFLRFPPTLIIEISS